MRGPGCTDGARDGDGLLERAEQLALLNEAVTAIADGGHDRTVLVLGEAGIGKTALLREFSDDVAGSARILWAGCDHLFTPRPLGRARLAGTGSTTGGTARPTTPCGGSSSPG